MPMPPYEPLCTHFRCMHTLQPSTARARGTPSLRQPARCVGYWHAAQALHRLSERSRPFQRGRPRESGRRCIDSCRRARRSVSNRLSEGTLTVLGAHSVLTPSVRCTMRPAAAGSHGKEDHHAGWQCRAKGYTSSGRRHGRRGRDTAADIVSGSHMHDT